MTWTDNGRHGKALVLDGVSEYLQIPETANEARRVLLYRMDQLAGGQGHRGQRRFLRAAGFHCGQGTTNWLTLSPHMRDASKTDDTGRILDGVYLGYNYGGNKGTLVEEWTPAVDGAETHTDCRWESGIIWLPSPPGGKCGYTSTAACGRTKRWWLRLRSCGPPI